MRRRMFRNRLLAVLGVLALVAAACGGDNDNAGSSSDSGGDENQSSDVNQADTIGFVNGAGDESGEPTKGGTLEFAPYVFPRTLDPSKQTDSGVGNAPLALFYDALMRYDYDKQDYVPWQAESLEHNDDYTVWTLKIRDGIKFSDGTPLNSEAVALQMKRTQENRPGLYTEGITTETPDDLTVIYTLPVAWPRFAYALSVNPGRIPSPAGLEKYGDDFDSHPVGSGPFVFESWTPGEKLVAKANEDYWDDGPYLDEVQFVNLIGDQAKLDSLNSGDIQGGFLRIPGSVTEAIEEGMQGFNNIFSVGEALIINNGVNSDDTPGHDPRVRKALAKAIDLDALNRDVNDGQGLWTKSIVGGDVSSLDIKVKATEYDPDGAKALLDEAKADGYDGAITLTCDSAPERKREGLALQAQLNAVGFDTKLDQVQSVGDTIQKYQKEGSFEIACYGFSLRVNAPYTELSRNIGPDNNLGYVNPDIEDLLLGLRTAASPEDEAKAVDAMQTNFNETQPYVPLAAVRELIAWPKDVHGIDVTSFNQPIFNRAWIEQ